MANNSNVARGLLIVLAIVVIAAFAWYYTYRYHTILVTGADGAVARLTCAPGQHIKVVSAKYSTGGAKAADVKAPLQTVLAALSGNSYTVSGVALGQVAGGTLSFRYKCVGSPTKAGFHPAPISACGGGASTKAGFHPAPVSVCGGAYAPSFEHYAESPEAAEPMNATVRAASARHRRGEALSILPDHVDDSTMSLMAAVTRRSPAVAGGSAHLLADIDSNFQTDDAALTSERALMPSTLTGLGGTRDPRFEPGSQSRVASGDASPSHGGHAGGITLGGFGSCKFQPGNSWDWNPGPSEAHSQW